MDLGVPINNVLNVKLFHVLFIPEQCAILITCIMLFSWPMLNLFTRHFKIPSWSPFDCINLSLLNSFFFFLLCIICCIVCPTLAKLVPVLLILLLLLTSTCQGTTVGISLLSVFLDFELYFSVTCAFINLCYHLCYAWGGGGPVARCSHQTAQLVAALCNRHHFSDIFLYDGPNFSCRNDKSKNTQTCHVAHEPSSVTSDCVTVIRPSVGGLEKAVTRQERRQAPLFACLCYQSTDRCYFNRPY